MMSISSLILIIAQFLLLGYLAVTEVWTDHIILTLIQLLGVVIAVWGILTIKINNFNIQPEVKSTELITAGPFKYIRNPMYLGILCVFTPAVFVHTNALRWFCLGLLTSVLLLKILREEYFLAQRFGEQYARYVARTKRLIPYVF